MKTEYTMTQLRAICADLGIRPAVSLKGTLSRIEEARTKQALDPYGQKFPPTTEIINAEPRKVGKVRELGMGYQGRRRKESAWIKRLMGTTALYAHQPFPGPTVLAPRLKGDPTGLGPLRLSGRIQRDLGMSRPPLWAGASTPSGVFDVSRYTKT